MIGNLGYGVALGIDPGLSGALAWVHSDGTLIEVLDMPTMHDNDKNKIDVAALCDLMHSHKVRVIIIEQVQTRTGEGNVGALTCGYGGGLLHGIAAAICLNVRIIPAATWKRCARVTANKTTCRARAAMLWPAQASNFARKRDDGRADAALLAHWAATLTVKQSAELA